MASPGSGLLEATQPPGDSPEPALAEAQQWIEQVTGRTFGDKDFRSGLENGVLLCELLNSIKPGLVKKINRLPTPIAGLDNIALFLRGCKELGLKESQLFDPVDLQDNSSKATVRNLDCSRKLKNVLVTIYWLGKTANSSTGFSGATLNLREFEGLLTQLRKHLADPSGIARGPLGVPVPPVGNHCTEETEDVDSPKRSIRDSGYVDCWDSERSDSLSPPRHGRDDSFDSLDSFGSRSQQTPSPDVVLRGSSDGRGSDSESDLPHRKLPDVKKDDMSARRTSYGEPKSVVPFNQYLPNKSNQTAYIPAPLRKKKAEREEFRKSWSTATSPLGGERPFRFGSRTPVSDDAESVSMFDMRCADEAAVMQPHSQARHEKLQTIHHQLKEEEDQWQDDLARWKSRRRSASQDLFKKEAERKKMERLLTGTEEATEWRKSIKTYREIVEEKERRERALHEAYKNARSREEADNILQQYIERFTISEAVLERLEMPKILERSHSAEPNSSSPPKDPNPMRYLRQQSLPAPKYTAKVEATIAPAGGSEASISTGRTSPSKAFVSKAVPMLTAKPYSQPKSTQQVLRTFKVDGKVSMNGEAVNGVEEERERECTTLIFAPSPSRSPKSNSVVDGSSVEGEQNSPSTELVLKRLIEHSKDRAQAGTLMEEAKSINQNEKTDSERLSPDHKEFSTTVSRASPTVAVAEFSSVTNSSLSNHRKEMGSNEEPKKLERGQLKDVEAPVIQKVETLEAPVPDGGIIVPLLKIIPERSQVVLQNSAPQAGTDNSDKSNRFGCWSWDPEEERKRQEQWQHEQERVLQERYQKEQDKLKEEWEKAQKEVEEEERKYYEEERKIIEDTVVPFTVTSSSAEPLSTSSSVTDGNGTVNMVDVSYSEEEDKQKEDRTRKNLFSEQEGVPFSKSKEYEPGKENMSTVNKEEYIGTSKQRGNEQDPQMSRTERLQPTEMTLPLCQDVTWNQQLLTKQSPRVSDTKQKNFPSEHNLGLPVSSAREMRRAGCRESSGAGRSSSSPCSPTTQRQSPNRYKRSVSGKKLCSSCGQPLGKGAAMIIETLGLYFHIQCFRCGICKGQLGDAASGTDVRIRSGLLNCNDCYIRSRTAGQPTTL
ncbi:LIM and calponin homology domains-containing protein 1 isoform X9 [Zootoca vivipara]|uniref:LIM and calponin homology domains-containing protein 1 isoform X9 n=1 Tax=Zootoca vivipara TaxID=8524 RepID=UPI00293B9F68|nr:LIM and calponin homology domains-containing protein 1 isoform X9 [Zootoca vivipara]